MLSNSTVGKLHEMKMSVMAKTFREQLEDDNMSSLSFEERFGLLVDAEWSARKTNRLKRLIRNANYDIPGACVEDIEYHPDRKLDKAMITRLGTCQYIEECHNIIILGSLRRDWLPATAKHISQMPSGWLPAVISILSNTFGCPSF